MPEYKDVLREDMPKYMNVIKAMLSECEHRFSFALLQFLIITMYEYCLCFAYFELNPSILALNGQKVTQNHIYSYLKQQRPIYDFHIVCEAFMQARHSAAHLSTEHFTHAKVKAIFTMGDFFELLSTFGFPEDALESLMKIEQYADNDNDNVQQKIIL